MFEYKFFTGNTAPKYVEGDYLLTVKGNMMEMKKVGEANTVKVSSVCKDGDTWSLQGGIENCLSKVPENTKINVGDTVKFKNDMNHFMKKIHRPSRIIPPISEALACVPIASVISGDLSKTKRVFSLIA